MGIYFEYISIIKSENISFFVFFTYIVTQNIDLVKVSGNSCKKKGVGSLDVKKNKTASFKINKTPSGNIFEFFCDLSHALVYSSKPIRADNPEEELMRAWGEGGKEYFNRCQKCGKWVIDAMYNPDVWSCVQCVPIEDYPDYCPVCGAKTQELSNFCHVCGAKLFYGGEEENEKTERK